MRNESSDPKNGRTANGPWSDLALHTIGWRAFQDLCSQVCEVVLRRPVEIFREAQDGGQDAVFLLSNPDGETAVGTVQCKHCSDPQKSLSRADLTPEIAHVKQLVKEGQADTYVLMTNMNVDAPVAIKIRAALRALGVRKPHVLGKQYLTRAIRSSARLRALVPQVYGLGDLTTILDERLSRQSRALLDDWIPKLKAYVPTRAHRRAVHALGEHGVVLLLGNPSSGKSAIGAILSTIASENPSHTVLALTSPRDFEAGWNPDDPGRFFWIDDAFGPNVLREDFVQDWPAAFRKVQAAISKGNKFILTSRSHIYEAAKRRLGQRNLHVFADGSAVIDVGVLTPNERAQILYNHIGFGRQAQPWKAAVKPFLNAAATTPNFLPGIAERLGDPTFTKGLALKEHAIVRFMEEPREHLIDTINALDDGQRAALLLVYVHQGAFDQANPDTAAADAVTEITGVALPHILECFSDMQGSFFKRPSPGDRTWSFAHPTISDALTEILREKPHMVPALLRGATIETILGGFICEGVTAVRDAMTVPASLNGQLVKRLIATPDEYARNWSLFSFIYYRASDAVIGLLIDAAPDILRRPTWASDDIDSDPRINALAAVHRLGLLDDEIREEAASLLEKAALVDFDLSFFHDSSLLSLIPPERLLSLGMKMRGSALPRLGDKIADIGAQADLDEEPEDLFTSVKDGLRQLERMMDDPQCETLVASVRQRMAQEVQSFADRKDERDLERRDYDVDWGEVVRRANAKADTPTLELNATPRSIFEDVDQ